MANETDRLLAEEAEKLQKRMERSAGEEAKRQLGLTARAAAPYAAGAAMGAGVGAMAGGVGAIPGALIGAGLTGIATPIADLATTGANAVKNRFFGGDETSNLPLPSQAMERTMTRMGLPEPANATERVVQNASRGVMDAASGAGAFRSISQAIRSLPQFQTAPAIPQALEAMGQAPGAQALSGGLGATVGSAAGEAGAGPVTSTVLGTAAGIVPSVRPGNLFPNQATAERQRMNAALQAEGVPLSPAQQLDNSSAAVFESVMRYLPSSAPRIARQEDEQGRAWTRAVMARAGVDADNALPETLQRVQRDFGQRYDTLERATMLQPDKRFGDELAALRANYRRGLDDSRFNIFEDKLNELERFVAARSQGATMAGGNFHQIDGELRNAASSALKSDDVVNQQFGRAMSDLRDSLQALMERSAQAQQRAQIGNQALSGTDLADAWRETNRQYAVFSRIKDAMGNATGRDKLNTGFIPPSALAQEQRNAIGRDQFALARDPFTDLVRAGAGVLPDPVPNSGTAQRSFAQDMLTGGKRGAPAAVAGATAHGVGAAAIDPVLSLALPWAVANRWYARPLSPGVQGLLAAQAMRGAANTQRPEDY